MDKTDAQNDHVLGFQFYFLIRWNIDFIYREFLNSEIATILI